MKVALYDSLSVPPRAPSHSERLRLSGSPWILVPRFFGVMGLFFGPLGQFFHDFLKTKNAQRPYDQFGGSIAPRSLLCVRKRKFLFWPKHLDFQTPPPPTPPPPPTDEPSDPNLTPLPTHPGIKYVARALAAILFLAEFLSHGERDHLRSYKTTNQLQIAIIPITPYISPSFH